MKKIDVQNLDIKLHNIIIAHTSEPDYEMSRQILLEMELYSGDYIVVEGSHCSCFDFDDTEWEAIEYSNEELEKIATAPYNEHDEFWKQVRMHLEK